MATLTFRDARSTRESKKSAETISHAKRSVKIHFIAGAVSEVFSDGKVMAIDIVDGIKGFGFV
jgi:hypothetical protein